MLSELKAENLYHTVRYEMAEGRSKVLPHFNGVILSRKRGYFIFARQKADRNHRRSLPQRSQHVLEHVVFWLKISFGSNREQRKPMLLLVFVGSFLLRLAERTLLSLLFHVPPRSTPPMSLHNRLDA